jgi:hypothetical protein
MDFKADFNVLGRKGWNAQAIRRTTGRQGDRSWKIFRHLGDHQGGKKSLWKNRPKCSPIRWVPTLMHNFYRWKGQSWNLRSWYFFLENLSNEPKRSTKRRKFAQSGDPGDCLLCIGSSSPSFKATFDRKSVAINLTKYGLGYILGDFFTQKYLVTLPAVRRHESRVVGVKRLRFNTF